MAFISALIVGMQRTQRKVSADSPVEAKSSGEGGRFVQEPLVPLSDEWPIVSH